MLTASCTECGNRQEFAIFFFPFETSLLSEMFHKMLFFTFVSVHPITSHCELLESRNEILFFVPLMSRIVPDTLDNLINNCLLNNLNEISAQPLDGNTIVCMYRSIVWLIGILLDLE